MNSPALRAAFFCASVFVFFTLVHSRALAVTEYCPALVRDVQPWPPGGAGAFSYDLLGFAPRELSGTIVVQSDSGWFTAPFSDARLITRDTRTRVPGEDSLAFTDFSSNALYLVFPKPLKIIRAWVSDATIQSTSAPKASGQHVSCGPLASDGDDEIAWLHSEVQMQPERVIATTPKDVVVSRAVAMPQPVGLNCKRPFVDSTGEGNWFPTTVAELEEDGQPHVVLVAVALNSNGALDDAWIYSSSGVPGLDAEALKSARSGEYTAGIALCKPAPTEALFRAEF